VSHHDLSTKLFGRGLPLPIAPTGLNELFWPHADLRLADAAAEMDIPFAQSTMSNEPMRNVARVPGLRYWWQLYVFGPQEVRYALIDPARDAGCEALIVTDDAQFYGNHQWATRNDADPKDPTWSAKLDAALHPCWLADLSRRGPLGRCAPDAERAASRPARHSRCRVGGCARINETTVTWIDLATSGPRFQNSR
jgi:(S)-mandelate dehydrogenase